MNAEKIFSILHMIDLESDKAKIRKSIVTNHSGIIKSLMRVRLNDLEQSQTLLEVFTFPLDGEKPNYSGIDEEKDACKTLLEELEALYTIKKYIDACQS